MVKRLKVCVGCLLQTDPQERAKTTTASSDCRPRPTVPDPVVPCAPTKDVAAKQDETINMTTDKCRRRQVSEDN